MKLVSYYAEPKQGYHWSFWKDGAGLALPKAIADDSTCILLPPREGNSRVDKYFKPIEGDFDVAYIQGSWYPTKRPAKYIYAIKGDIIGYENETRRWIDAVEPNYFGCLEVIPDWLPSFCAIRGIVLEKFLHFIVQKQCYYGEKLYDGMISGAIGPSYRIREVLAVLLQSIANSYSFNLMISCGSFGNYHLSHDEYVKAVQRTKYYFSGGIHDIAIPPKYVEVMGYGACLVSPALPWMKDYGFVDGETYVKWNAGMDIVALLKSDVWIKIGRAGQRLVHQRHMVFNRAQQIRGWYWSL